jgi:hypothetical protein
MKHAHDPEPVILKIKRIPREIHFVLEKDEVIPFLESFKKGHVEHIWLFGMKIDLLEKE